MKTCYQLILHHRPDQVAWLFGALYNVHDYFLIHVAANARPADSAAIRQLVGQRPNVRFQRPNTVAWGGWSLARTELEGIAAAVAWADDWSWFINLSGQCYPLTGRAERLARLARLGNRSAVVSNPVDGLPAHIRRRTWFHCVEWGGRMHRLPLPRPDLLHPRIHWKGSFWHVLARDFCEWTLASGQAEDLARDLRSTANPDEFFIANLIQRSPFRDRRINDDLRFARWRPGAANPETLGMADLPDMLSGGRLFARKFDGRRDGRVLHRLADRIGAPMSRTLEAVR